jgi:hypothetical protein
MRVPNPTYERNESKILVETLEGIPRGYDVAREFYGEDISPIFEVIIPMAYCNEEIFFQCLPGLKRRLKFIDCEASRDYRNLTAGLYSGSKSGTINPTHHRSRLPQRVFRVKSSFSVIHLPDPDPSRGLFAL